MASPSPGMGKIRGLMQLADGAGIFRILACDQRGTMAEMMASAGVAHPGFQELSRAKVDIVGAAADRVSGVLLDPEYGGIALASRVLPGRVGLAVPIEATGYEARAGDRLARPIAEWSVAKIKRMGASAVKLLVHYNPTRSAAAEAQDAFIARVAADCRRFDIPLILEGVVYPAPGQDPAAFAAVRTDLVVATAERLTAHDIDLYKAEFPVHPDHSRDRALWERAAARLHAACRTPWALLSAGVDFETYAAQLEVACAQGASGFVAGRAIWQEAIRLRADAERGAFLRGEMLRRLDVLAAIAARGRPWFEAASHRYRPEERGQEGWHAAYPEP
ncbi:MAG TPA: tagatose 1,6-diphosphate aldolase [Limnochordia bacterium]